MTATLLASLAQPEPYRFGVLSELAELACELTDILDELTDETPDTVDTSAGALTRA